MMPRTSFIYPVSVLALLSTVVAISYTSVAVANPNYLKPEVYLETHGTVPEAIPLAAECIQAFETFRDLVTELEKKIDPKKFSAAYAAQQRFIRLNMRLKQFGEPLSFDLQTRFADPNGRFSNIRNKFIVSQECGAIAKKIAEELRKKEKARLKLVEQMREMVTKAEWEATEKLWDKSMNAFWPQLAFLEGQQLSQFALAFYAIEDGFREPRANARCAVFQKAIDEKHQEHKLKLDTFLETLRLAPGQLASTGRIAMSDNSIPGSDAIKQFTIDFGQRHIDLMQDASLDFLATATKLGPAYENASSPTEHPAKPGWIKTAEAATKELQSAIFAIVSTEAQSNATTTTADYFTYLQSFAFAMNRFASTTSSVEFNPSLDMLAKKVGLEKSVLAYREATRDVLFWRTKIADRMDKLQREKEFPELDIFVRANLIKDAAGVSRISASRAGNPTPMLIEPFSKLVPAGWENLKGKMVSVGEVARFDSDKDLFMSRLNYGTYARPIASFKSMEHIGKLKSELLVDDTHPALDLAAAYAIYEAESGEVMDLGGEITGMHFESSSTRMLKLPPIAGNFLRYPVIQNSVYPKDEMSALCIRFDLKPKWFATRHQFVRLP